ncbi:MAG: NAD(+) synthase [Candidatus Poribacteria bacterium]|nr:NAD(+) synthase [Candidatus Poribacteria bacterium]
MRLATLATCNLNQWSLDFDGNLDRILQSIQIAKEQDATYRLGPELEVTGYSCEDAFLEEDTFLHAWEVMAEILSSDATEGILCDIGMPISHKNVSYNCRVLVLNQQILMIRPKIFLANDGNYRETRWFSAWSQERSIEPFSLPETIRDLNQQHTAPIGIAAIATRDTTVASETCEELFTPKSPHIGFGLDGIEIITNGSGSHHQLRKLNERIDLIRGATAKGGGVYLYANQQGCDGSRLYFDGCALIAINGEIVAQGSQFSLDDVEVITATVDLQEVCSFRRSISSRSAQATQVDNIQRISIDFDLTTSQFVAPTKPITVFYHQPEEEIAYGPACWLWDYLRRSGSSGYFVPISGGADSSSTIALVGSMCQLVVESISRGNQQTLADIRKVLADETYMPSSAHKLANRILHTCYMASENSSKDTKDRAQAISEQIGNFHLNANIDGIVNAFLSLFVRLTGKQPQFKVNGGSLSENLALQNIQARTRMVLAYLLAQLLPWVRGYKGGLLVLGSANVDESLRGYVTKYDCSSADINPIGGISKRDLRQFLRWAANHLGYPALIDVVNAPPTAELEPITENYNQKDEIDMGMTYDELGKFGILRKVHRCGPVRMFEKLVYEWEHLSPAIVAEKVKRFFFYYSVNRHKMTTMTPSYHAELYSPEDNRFDLRQFLYNVRWSWQFRQIDQLVKKLETKN